MLVLIFFFFLAAATSSGSAALTASEALVAPMVSLAASDDVDAARPRSRWAETLQHVRSRKADDSPKSKTRMVVVTAYYGSSMPLREVTWPNKVAYCKRHGYDAVDLYASDDVVRDGTRTLGHVHPHLFIAPLARHRQPTVVMLASVGRHWSALASVGQLVVWCCTCSFSPAANRNRRKLYSPGAQVGRHGSHRDARAKYGGQGD